MRYHLHLRSLSCCCCNLGRATIPVWGYLKLILGALLFQLHATQMVIGWWSAPVEFTYFYNSLTFQIFLDMLFQILLLVAFFKKSVRLYAIYHIYTIILWMIAITLALWYAICFANGNTQYMSTSGEQIDVSLVINIAIMMISAVFQFYFYHKYPINPPDDDTEELESDFKSTRITLEIAFPTKKKEVGDQGPVGVMVDEMVSTSEKEKLIAEEKNENV